MVIILHGHVTFIFLLFLSISSDLSAAEKPPPEPKQHTKITITHQKLQMMEPAFTLQRDSIPIINPTTPGTYTPIIPVSPPSPLVSTPILPYPVTTPIIPYPTPTPTPTTPTTTTPTPVTTSGGGSWCIANPGASETALQVAIDYACGYGGADCSAIQPSGSCYNPNTLRDHASYAFNDYYQKNPVPTSCVFGGTAQVTYTDPSQGSCHFGSSGSSTPVTPPSPATPTPVVSAPITPIVDTPTTSIPSPFYATPMTPYGVAEPTGSPNSAISTTCSLLVLVTSGLVASFTADYLL